jgi:hypothetical protein
MPVSHSDLAVPTGTLGAAIDESRQRGRRCACRVGVLTSTPEQSWPEFARYEPWASYPKCDHTRRQLTIAHFGCRNRPCRGFVFWEVERKMQITRGGNEQADLWALATTQNCDKCAPITARLFYVSGKAVKWMNQ